VSEERDEARAGERKICGGCFMHARSRELEGTMEDSMRPRDLQTGPDSPEVSHRIQAALKLVSRVVWEMKDRLAAHARADDLTSFGNEGALLAGRTFDPDFGVPLESWARMKIRQAIIDGLRVQADLPRRMYKQLRALEAAHAAAEGLLLDEAGSPPPGSAAAADARIGDRLAAMAAAYAAGTLMARDPATMDALADGRGSAEEELAREELKAKVRAAIAERPEAERALLEQYYFEEKTMAEASGGLSRSWASRLHARALNGVARSLMKAKVSGIE
jgi:RNA polymerase sigma factor for flagellar operon FliA